jgi:hypothetical protein
MMQEIRHTKQRLTICPAVGLVWALVITLSTAPLAPTHAQGASKPRTAVITYTKVTAADVFEVGATPESFLDSWPLKKVIAKAVTPALLADIAAEYRRGRRLDAFNS